MDALRSILLSCFLAALIKYAYCTSNSSNTVMITPLLLLLLFMQLQLILVKASLLCLVSIQLNSFAYFYFVIRSNRYQSECNSQNSSWTKSGRWCNIHQVGTSMLQISCGNCLCGIYSRYSLGSNWICI